MTTPAVKMTKTQQIKIRERETGELCDQIHVLIAQLESKLISNPASVSFDTVEVLDRLVSKAFSILLIIAEAVNRRTFSEPFLVLVSETK